MKKLNEFTKDEKSDAIAIFNWLMNLSDEETLYYAKSAKESGHLARDYVKVAFKARWKRRKGEGKNGQDKK